MNIKSSTESETQAVLDSIRRVVRALRISSCATEKDLGLSSAQLYVLQKLSDGEGVSINELAARTLTHQSSVSVVVGKLVERGWVKRRKSKLDARKVEISITPSGLRQLSGAPQPIQERLIVAIESLPAGKRKTLSEALSAIVRAAGISEGPAPLFFEDKSK